MKKLFSLIICISLIMSVFAAFPNTAFATVTSGTCGDELTWEFDDATGTLTISGTGDMYVYELDPTENPWDSFRGSIQSIIIADGVTSVCAYAFYACESLTSVNISGDVKEIAEATFENCLNLENIVFNEGLETIGPRAFYNCTSLGSVSFPSSLKTIKGLAFGYCTDLGSANLPEGLLTLEKQAFRGCSSLSFASIPHSLESIGKLAFADILYLFDIYFYGTQEEWNSLVGYTNIGLNDYTIVHYVCEIEGHVLNGDFTITLQPTPEQNGEMTTTCSRCGEVVTLPIYYVLGDANGDGSLNVKDIVSVKSYVAGTTGDNGIARTNADLDGDGLVNVKDLSALKVRIAG